jgi:hypothetical protein
MKAQRSKNFKEFYRSTGEHSINILGHVRLTLLGLYLGWTNQPDRLVLLLHETYANLPT